MKPTLSRGVAAVALLGLAAAGMGSQSTAGAAAKSANEGPSGIAAAGRIGRSVFVNAGDGAALAAVRGAGGRRIADYGSFSLWKVTAATPQLAAAPGVSDAGMLDELSLRGRVINTSTGAEPRVPAALRNADKSGRGLHIVQFAGPVKRAWLRSVTKLGLRVVSTLPPNGYLVYGTTDAIAKLDASAAGNEVVNYTGAFRPLYRISPDLLNKAARQSATSDVTVQVVKGAADDIAAVAAFGRELRGRLTIVGVTNLTLRVPTSAIDSIAKLAAVVNVEPYFTPELMDEKQNQILAGNITTVGGKKVPTGPGYIAFLASKGFSTNPANHVRVAVVDDGVDDGTNAPNHSDFYRNGVVASGSRLVGNFDCTTSGSPRGDDGHGNLNAGIVGGFNNAAAFPNEDGGGYQYGLGVDPNVRLSNVKIFGPNFVLTNCGNSLSGVVERAFSQGARITSNSWGSNAGGAYIADSQAYDALTRDGSAATAGAQQMLHVFSAGNAGSGLNTVGAPGTAKNVLTVSATENVRDNGVSDGCSEANADNADDMAGFSSRGPTDDLRAKPDISAPGTHVQGPASQIPTFNGTGVCGPGGAGLFYPAGQTKYTWSSGTSHSAPAVSGAAALAAEYYKRAVSPGNDASPAMLKALLLNSPRYLNGVGSGGTLPQVGQGWGDVNINQLVDTSRTSADQAVVFTATGQQNRKVFTIANAAKPTRITMAFSDAPGATVGNSYVNDLDLVVVAGGKLYRGNVFSGAQSVTGGAGDPRNNVEQVWLPAGITGKVAVQVIARNIAGNGVPGGGALDQDFALTAVNLTPVAAATPVPYVAGFTATDAGAGSNANGAIEPGEPFRVRATLGNLGTAATVAGTVAVTVASGAATVIDGKEPVGAIGAGAQATTAVGGMVLRLNQAAACGATVSLKFDYATAATLVTSTLPLVTSGGGALTTTTVNSTDVPKAIPDLATVASTLTAPSKAVSAIRVRVGLTHTFDGDLSLAVTGPGGGVVLLAANRGSSGDNYTGTTFSDAAATAIGAGTPPFTGAFRPEQPLAAFIGTNSAGTWTMRITDSAADDVGTLTSWGIDIDTKACVPAPKGVAIADAATVAEGTGAGTTAMTFNVVRTGPITTPLSVIVHTVNGTAVAPGDYTARAVVVVNFAPGEHIKPVVVQVKKDVVVEPNETVKLAFTLPLPAATANVRDNATGQITNDD